MGSISFGNNSRGLQVGNSSGLIHAEIHLPPERPETPPNPLSTVPFARDSDFIARDILLHRIRQKSSVPGSRIGLVGLGGVGKSQLAIEYSYQVRSESPATWVFWVHASNEARFEQSFRDIADQVKIPGHQDPKINIFKLVEHWLRDEKNGKWICILDNADDDKFLFSLPATGKGALTTESTSILTKPPLEYVPRGWNGSVIVTSRSREVALKMVDHKGLIEVKPMESFEAQELLQRKLEQPGESQESQQLVEELEFIPLAIVQAASYIMNRAPRYSVSQYLRDFRGSDRNATRLLQNEAGHLYRDWEAKNSILVTWQISFDYISQNKPYAADLLFQMSFFDRQGIPESLVRLQPEANCKSSSECIDDSSGGETSESDTCPDFEDNITTLRDYSFISVRVDNNMFTMHRLVQLTTRAWLKSRGQLIRWREKSISNLYQEYPNGEYENWGKCRSLFPHVLSAMSQRPVSPDSLLKWATLLYKGAWYALESGNIADARGMASKSRKERLKLLDGKDKEAIASTAMLARACLLEGRWEEAEQLFVQALETSKTNLGVDHPDTLMSMANLASTYRKQGRWEKAEQLQVQALETRKMKLGVNHPDTLMSMADLATIFWDQGRLGEAEQIQVQVLETRQAKLGVNHPDTLMSMADLATIFCDQGRWDEAERLQVQALETRKAELGVNHPDTLMSMANLATILWNQGRWNEAEQLEVQALETRKAKLGVDHPDTLISMADLATTFCNQGRLEEAERLQVQALETRKMKLGMNHPDTLMSMADLAITFCNQGRRDKAEKLQVEVLETRKAKLGVDHPDTLMSMADLASMYRNQGRLVEAEQLNVQALETRKIKLGMNHPDTLMSMADLASIYRNQGRFGEAEQLNVQVLETSKTKLGADHPDTLASTANLALTYRKQGRWEEAEQLYMQALETSKTKLGVNHPSTLTSIDKVAFI